MCERDGGASFLMLQMCGKYRFSKLSDPIAQSGSTVKPYQVLRNIKTRNAISCPTAEMHLIMGAQTAVLLAEKMET